MYMSSKKVAELVELKYFINIVEEKKNKIKILKKNVPVKKLVHIQDIKNPTQVFSKRGVPLKGKCSIFVKDEGEMVVNIPYEKMKEILSSQYHYQTTLIGFKLKNDNR